ncbi:N-acetylglutamate synthase-like GNAT family acetyltransferase [Paenibacillus cellulosilyticus]|uniref:N-acetylglutamate synthase-like GNAT family acetyltransferase n=1 Tax=Paenibacillus cellulosilyticus TaxID=375489 RepID=A0A2V2YLS0_9BACL|nr:GNAT family N-acetyltransferase [Paenibacillus cellulosilyticus]PWV94444.1 N-acetylglutamate synthase-like GNAT family acetyltransferase [Paenibacillus cellulosilyticus]QKS44965.1 GNAT family N-acetyltransferase [Paenibacillus cellulosilyticus]
MIREAEASDVSELYRLYRMLLPNSKKLNVVEERIIEIRNDSKNFIYVYESDNKIIGTLTLTICLEALHGSMSYGVIENVVVDETLRGNGIGQQLMDYAERYCRSIRCSKIMLLSNSKRESAHHFFASIGYDSTVSKAFKKYLRYE